QVDALMRKELIVLRRDECLDHEIRNLRVGGEESPLLIELADHDIFIAVFSDDLGDHGRAIVFDPNQRRKAFRKIIKTPASRTVPTIVPAIARPKRVLNTHPMLRGEGPPTGPGLGVPGFQSVINKLLNIRLPARDRRWGPREVLRDVAKRESVFERLPCPETRSRYGVGSPNNQSRLNRESR